MRRDVARIALASALVLAGVGHLTFLRNEFRAQVPGGFPVAIDLVVVASGVVELLLGAALLLVRRRRQAVGVVVAIFFVLIVPGNLAQFLEGTDAFGLDSDGARLGRLFFQPLLVLWALWATQATKLAGGRRSRAHRAGGEPAQEG
jgi:uncharacterized membrane protein